MLDTPEGDESARIALENARALRERNVYWVQPAPVPYADVARYYDAFEESSSDDDELGHLYKMFNLYGYDYFHT